MVAPAYASALQSAPARVVIVDDHPNTAAMLARTLGEFSRPVDIITARSGQEALDRLGNAAVDVLITDFMMPNMNGLELIEKLNASSGGALRAAHTILITAYDSPGLALTARRLRVNDYLVKPVQPERIREIVSRVLDGLTPLKAPVTEPAAATHFKLLIADDHPDNIRVLTKHLEPEGYTFVTAGDGEEALQKVRAELPDLVLLDVNMPRKNGFEVLTEIRADPEVAHIPVVMVTAARVEPRDIRTGLGLGADDYVTKPFDWRELAARVRAKLRVKQVEDALRRRNHELGLLPEIGQELSARLDVEELANVVLQRTVAALGASMGHLAVFHPDGGVLHKTHVEDDCGPLTRDETQRAEQPMVAEGLIAYVTAARRGTIVEDADHDPRWLKMPDDPVRSAVAVPLLSRRGVIGVLTLSHDRPAYFNSDHLTLLQAIASQAAIAIENAQLYAVELKRVKELAALNQLTRDLSLYTRSAALFERVPHLIRESLGYPMVSLWLTDAERAPGGPTLRSVAGAENGPPQTAWALAPRRVAASGRPAVLSASVDDLVAKAAGGAPVGPHGGAPTQSAVAVPLFWEAKVSGVLCVHSARANAFQESDRVLLETLAAQIAAALERIRLFESVEQEEQRLAAVLRGAADAILVLDSEGRLRLVNPAGQELFTDVETRLDQPLPASRGYDGLIGLLARARRLGVPLQGEIPWPDKRTFAVLITPIEDGGQVAVLNDVTRFKDLERVKNEFIATASHDLKNPINAMLGYGDLLVKAGPLNERQADYAERMRQAAMQMHDLVLNLLELARIDLGVDLKLEVCDVLDLLTSVTDEFRAQGAAKNLTLTLDALDGRPRVRGDPTRLRQVIRNLVGNAVKYTPGGGQVTVSAVTDLRSVAQVQIRDTGIGIPPADLPFIFDKFYRAQTEGTKGIEGNGLGLAIVKSIVEQHGGRVSVDTKLGQGSCFSISLPLALAAQAAPTTVRGYSQRGTG